MDEDKFISESELLETLGEFTDTVLLPAIDELMDQKLDEKFGEAEKRATERHNEIAALLKDSRQAESEYRTKLAEILAQSKLISNEQLRTLEKLA